MHKRTNTGAAEVPHALRDQQRMVNRVRRLRGQVEAIERALTDNASCTDLIQRVTAARGAIDGLMAEILEEHVREYLLADKELPAKERAHAAEELIGIIHSYLT
jgi:FrmR/RcnR family transcriptional regulator, repressor of frmRAB operon